MPSSTPLKPLVVCALLACPLTNARAQDTDTMDRVVLTLPDENGHVLHLRQAPIPEHNEDQILVEVHAAAIIGYEWKVRKQVREEPPEGVKPDDEFPLGYDISGVVVSVGDNVTDFKPGDEVFAYTSMSGAYAQYAVGNPSNFAHKPKELTHEQAASLPVSGICALHSLLYMIDIQEGQSILIHGGAGGVGHFAIQIAKNRGATVYTTASGHHLDFVRELGADIAIDYRNQTFEDIVPPVDYVVDLIGGEVRERSLKVLKPDGFLLTYTSVPEESYYEENNIKGAHCYTPADEPEKLLELAQMVIDGTVTTHIDAVYPMADFREAFDFIEHGSAKGKIVLKVR
ncbi:MAG: NADP-dependent oxidoreductase [Phycisphaerales bacterium JB043]